MIRGLWGATVNKRLSTVTWQAVTSRRTVDWLVMNEGLVDPRLRAMIGIVGLGSFAQGLNIATGPTGYGRGNQSPCLRAVSIC